MSPRITLREAAKLREQRGESTKDLLTADEILAIKDTPTLKDAAKKHSGTVLNALLRNAVQGDTQAAKEILERGHGKVSQGIDITAEFTIKALHAHILTAALPADPTPTNGPLIEKPEK